MNNQQTEQSNLPGKPHSSRRKRHRSRHSGKGASGTYRRLKRFIRKHYMKIFAVIFIGLVVILTILFIMYDQEHHTVD